MFLLLNIGFGYGFHTLSINAALLKCIITKYVYLFVRSWSVLCFTHKTTLYTTYLDIYEDDV